MTDLTTRADALDEQIQRMRKELDTAKAELDQYAVLNPQQCPAGKHADWLVDSEYAHACPWCQIEELRQVVQELACPTCHGSGLDPDDEGDWVPEAGMYNPSTIGPCPTCNGRKVRAA